MYSGFELWRVTTCGKPKLIGFFTTIMSHFPPLEGERKRTPKSIVVFLQSCSTVEELIQPGSFWAKLQNHPNLRWNDVCRFSIIYIYIYTILYIYIERDRQNYTNMYINISKFYYIHFRPGCHSASEDPKAAIFFPCSPRCRAWSWPQSHHCFFWGDEMTLVGTNFRRMGLYVCVNYSIYRYRERYKNAIYI